MPHELKDLEVAEVSLVDRAAIRRKFFLMKKRSEENSMKELLLKAGGAISEGLLALLKHISEMASDTKLQAELAKAQLSDKARMAVAAALRSLETVKEELPGNIMQVLAGLGGYDYPQPQQQPGAGGPMGKSGDFQYGKFMKMKKNAAGEDEPDLDALPADVRPLVEGLWKAQQAIGKSAKEQVEALQKSLQEQSQALAKAQEERETTESIAKAAKFDALPTKAQEFGPVLRKMTKALTPAELELVEKMLLAGNAALKAQLSEQGSSGDGGTADTADAKLAVKAREIQKKEGKITYEQAYLKAIDENPELARAEREERDRGVRSAQH